MGGKTHFLPTRQYVLSSLGITNSERFRSTSSIKYIHGRFTRTDYRNAFYGGMVVGIVVVVVIMIIAASTAAAIRRRSRRRG